MASIQRTFTQGKLGLADRSIDWVGGTIEVALFDSLQAFNAIEPTYMDQLLVTATEWVGTGYSRQAVTGHSIALLDGEVEYYGETSFAAIEASGGLLLRYAVYYENNGSDPTNRVICVGGWSGDITPDGTLQELIPSGSGAVMRIKG